MKKHTTLYFMILSVLTILFLAGCGYSPIVEQYSKDEAVEQSSVNAGDLSITLNVLDYKNSGFQVESSNSLRIIDPQSETLEIVLEGTTFTTVDLEAEGDKQITSFGFQWSGSVSIPVPLSGSYDTLTLNFLDGDGNTLTTGSMTDVAVTKDATIPVEMGCLPKVYTEMVLPEDFTELNVTKGASLYYAMDMVEQTAYLFDAVAAIGSDPDIYIFTEDGHPETVSDATGSSEILELICDTTGRYFVGVYAAESLSDLSFSVEETNLLPVVVIEPDKVADADEVLNFSAEGSYDPEGGSLTYSWDFGDITTAAGLAVSHQYTEAGEYTVTLTVTDEKDGESTITLTAYIAQGNIAPVADAGTDIEIKLGDPVQLDGSASYDPEGASLSYSWDFDGENSTEDSPLIPSEFFTTAGTYDFVLTVSDDDVDSPLVNSDTVTVTIVNNILPVASAGSDKESSIDEVLSFSAANSSDVDDDFSTLTYEWNFGDGSDVITTQDANHSYSVPGTYTVSLTVTDPYGGIGIDHVNVTVKDAFVFNLSYEGENSFDANHPLKLALIDYTVSGIAYVETASTDGQYTIYTSDISRYNNAHQYILAICHDMDNDLVGNWINGDVLGDAADFNGLYSSLAEDHVVYNITVDNFDLTDAEIATGSYDIVFTDQNGQINIIAQ